MGRGAFAKLDLKPRGLLKDSRPPSPMKHLGLVNLTVSALLAHLLEKLSSLASCIPGCWYARNSLDKQAEKSCLYSEYANKTSLESVPSFPPTLPLSYLLFSSFAALWWLLN